MASANATTTDAAAPVADTKYFYRVRALGAGGNSAYTAAISNTTLPSFVNTLWVDASYAGTTVNGSFTTPFKTIASAMTAALPGDGVVMRGGTYREAVTMKSGTAGSPITLIAQPNERATVSGFAAVTGWTLSSGNVYVANSAVDLINTGLYVGYDAQEQSKEPDDGMWRTAAPAVNGTTSITFTDTNLVGLPSLVGATLTAWIEPKNDIRSAIITAHDNVAGTVTVAYTADLATSIGRYMVRNSNSGQVLDRPGEWASIKQPDNTYKIYFWPENAADLSNTQRRSVANLISISGKHDITIRNLELAGGYTAAIAGAGGITADVTNLILTGNTIHDAGTAVYLHPVVNANISYNRITDSEVGVNLAWATDVTVHGNEIGFIRMDGITVGGDWMTKLPTDPAFRGTNNVVISSNHIHHMLATGHPDGIQTYFYPTNLKILNNIIQYAGQGIMMENTNNTEIAGNIISSITARLMNLTGTINLHNNTLIGGGWEIMAQLAGYWGNGPVTATENIYVGRFNAPTNYTGTRNLFYGSTPSATRETAAITGDPKFVSAPMGHMAVGDIDSSTTSVIYLRDLATTYGILQWAVGDHVEVNGDGVMRTITAINTTTKAITLDIPLPKRPVIWSFVDNWKTGVSTARNYALQATSPALTYALDGGRLGHRFNDLSRIAGDMDDDGDLDLPSAYADLIASTPTATNWPLY